MLPQPSSKMLLLYRPDQSKRARAAALTYRNGEQPWPDKHLTNSVVNPGAISIRIGGVDQDRFEAIYRQRYVDRQKNADISSYYFVLDSKRI